MFAPMLLLLAAVPAIAGLYEARQMEVGAALELRKNGHFRYQLDYGAVSEEAEGRWVVEGGTLFLTTWPRPHPPSFELVRDDLAPVGEVSIELEPPGFGKEGYRIEAIATDASTGERGLVVADQQGRIDSGGRKLSSMNRWYPSTRRSPVISRSLLHVATISFCGFTPMILARPLSTGNHSP